MEYDLGVSVDAPTSVITGVANATGGSLSAGNYLYKYTFLTVNGETLPSAASASIAVVAGGSVTLTLGLGNNIESVIGRKIYRTAAGGSSFAEVIAINDDVTTSYTDTASDASISGNSAPPLVNTAISINGFNGIIKAKDTIAGTFTNGIVASTTSTQAGGVLLNTTYNIISAVNVAGNSVTLPPVRVVGEIYWVRNNGALAADVFPSVGDSINSGGANVAFSLAASLTVRFLAVSATAWVTF